MDASSPTRTARPSFSLRSHPAPNAAAPEPTHTTPPHHHHHPHNTRLPSPTKQVATNTDADLFGRALVRAVIDVKWESYARAFLLLQFAQFLAFLALFLAYLGVAVYHNDPAWTTAQVCGAHWRVEERGAGVAVANGGRGTDATFCAAHPFISLLPPHPPAPQNGKRNATDGAPARGPRRARARVRARAHDGGAGGRRGEADGRVPPRVLRVAVVRCCFAFMLRLCGCFWLWEGATA